jgi:protein gp138
MASPPDKSLAEVVTDAIDSRLLDLHTCMPGIVRTYDDVKGVCKVQPAVKRKIDGELETLPEIENVAVMWPGAGGAVLKMALAAGDMVWLMFPETDWARYRESDSVTEPGDITRHDLTGCVAYPMARVSPPAALGPGWYTTVPVYVGAPTATSVALAAALVALHTAAKADVIAAGGAAAALIALDTPPGTFATAATATKLKAT